MSPNCLTEVDDIPILEQLVNNLRTQGFERLVVVIGHLGNHIQKKIWNTTQVVRGWITSSIQCTGQPNNMYSLLLARQQIREPFLLVESDLIFEASMLTQMLKPDKIAISRMLPWMNGTKVELGSKRRVTAFCLGGINRDKETQYKTVNLYSFPLHSRSKIAKR